MAITFVAAATPYTRTSSSTAFTLNAPAGIAAGDIMLATVAWNPGGSTRSITAPTGWVTLRTQYGSGDGNSVQIALLFRQATASEPADWTGSVSASTSSMVTGVSAYRGAQGSLGSNAGSAGLGTSFSTGSVTNTGDTNSWRIVAGAYTSGSASYNITSNETTRRWIEESEPSTSTQAAQWDSNAGVSTSSHSRTVSRSANWSCAAGIIMILAASTGTPATGTLESTLGNVVADGEGEAHNDGVVDADLPALAFEGDGFGQPPVAVGDLEAPLAAVSVAAEGGTDVSGDMTALLSISAEFVGETRLFGVRVVNVEFDDRTIVVESRGVAD